MPENRIVNNTMDDADEFRIDMSEFSNAPDKWSIKQVCIVSSVILVIILGFLALLFFWQRDIHWNEDGYVLDNELWGTFGDFAGGAVGLFLSLFGCILMIWTFREQRRLSEKTNYMEIKLANNSSRLQSKLSKTSQRQAELQRFNDLFFELLDLYRQQAQDLNRSVGNGSFFDEYMRVMRNNFKSYNKFGHARRYAGEKYLEFYGRHAWEIAPHFRTLYRIFNLIESSEIDDEKRLEYAKVVRAQLSEGELFFLRYNAMSQYGKNFIKFINKYRLLKHLPFLSLLETKKFRDTLINDANPAGNALNVVLYEIGKEIHRRITGKEELTNNEIVLQNSAKYKLSLLIPHDRITIVKLEKDNNVRNVPVRLRPLDSLSNESLLRLVYDVVREIFLFSNFGKYNPSVHINMISQTKVNSNGNKSYFWVTVKNEQPLRLSHPDWD